MIAPRRSLIEVPHVPARGLAATTQDERKRMTVPELIVLMGPLHVNHPDYKPKPGSLLPVPNLAGRLPILEEADLSLWSLMKQAIRWAAR